MVKKKNNPNRRRKQRKTKQSKNAQPPPGVSNAPYKPASAIRNREIRSSTKKQPVPRSVHQKVCGITDPFCIHARGAKWPDGQGAGTAPFQIRGRLSVNTGITNNVNSNLFQFSGDLPYALLTPLSNSATIWTMNATYTDVTSSTNFTTYFQYYRIVSWGIIVRNILPATTSQGTVLIRKLNRGQVVSGQIVNATMYGSEVQEYPVFPGMEISVIAKTQGNIARSFQGFNTNTTIVNAPNWDTIQVELLNGAASTNGVLDIEYVYNVEGQLAASQAVLHEFIPPSAPKLPAITNAADTVLNKATSIVEGGIKTVGSTILGHVENFFEQAGTDLLASLF